MRAADTSIAQVLRIPATMLAIAVAAPEEGHDDVFFAFDLNAPALLRVSAQLPVGSGIIVAVTRGQLRTLFGCDPAEMEAGSYHLPSNLRAIALALVETGTGGALDGMYRSAKLVELVCETLRQVNACVLVPAVAAAGMSLNESLGIMAARRMIDERWSEKLTLSAIARACGINRRILTTGFRKMFQCSVGEAIAERRLLEARAKLLTTDLKVARIGYDSGFTNAASFTRAFQRRFAMPPARFRALQLAA